jgi:hypothetical protein
MAAAAGWLHTAAPYLAAALLGLLLMFLLLKWTQPARHHHSPGNASASSSSARLVDYKAAGPPETIKAAKHCGDSSSAANPLDSLIGMTNHTCFTAFVFEQTLDDALLKKSLAEALSTFPILAGRLAMEVRLQQYKLRPAAGACGCNPAHIAHHHTAPRWHAHAGQGVQLPVPQPGRGPPERYLQQQACRLPATCRHQGIQACGPSRYRQALATRRCRVGLIAEAVVCSCTDCLAGPSAKSRVSRDSLLES